MATLAQSLTYHAIRQNEDWSELDPAFASALLQDAEDYIRLSYPIRSDLTADEQRVLDGIVCRLADVFRATPPQVAATAAVKKESKELAGMKKSLEYADAPTDPYPYITAVLRPFIARAPTIAMGRLVRQ